MTDTATDTESKTTDAAQPQAETVAQMTEVGRPSEPTVTEPAEPARATPPEVARAEPAPATPPRRRGVPLLVGMLLGAAAAGGAGYGVQRYLIPQPVFDAAPLESRLTAAEAESQGLRAEIARLSEATQTPAIPDQALLDRLAALEATEAPDLAPLVARLDQLEANLAALANLPSETGVSPAALAALQAEVAALKSQKTGVPAEISATAEAVEARLAEAEARATELAAQTADLAATSARTAALGQIGAALDSGLPFGAALTALTDTEVPAALSAQAQTGVPTIAALRDAFPDAARLALEQALRAKTGESWTDRVATFLRNQTGARSLAPREGNDPDAILSRAEAALATADLQTAMTELAALPPEAQTALADWTARARQRLDAQTAYAGLLQAAGQ